MTTAQCPYCGFSLVEITITLRSNPVVMRSCGHCDRRWWHADGRDVDLNAALAAD